jgi:hypothetical protein
MMKQKTKQLIILLGVFLLLLAGWLCVSLLTAEDSTDADESVSGMTYQVANVDQQTVTEISYTLNGQTYTYALKDDATGWLWNEDPTLPLDNLYFANMVTAFTALTSTVRLTDITPTELMDYGLGEDALKIGFTDAAGARVYRIGKYNTYNGLCYFCDERDMTAIYMVAGTVGDNFRFTPYQMIALPTLPTDITPAKIMTVTLTPPAGSAAQPSVYTYYVGGKVEGETDVWYGAVGTAEEARLSTEDGKALSTALTTMVPPAFVQGDMQKALREMGTKEGVERLRKTLEVSYPDWDNYAVSLGWDRILISSAQPGHEKYLGLNVVEAAEKFGFEDAAALAAHLMHTENGQTAIISLSMDQSELPESLQEKVLVAL